MVLALTLLLMMISSLRGVYAYRELARMISQRAAELKASAELQKATDTMRSSFREFGLKPNETTRDTFDLVRFQVSIESRFDLPRELSKTAHPRHRCRPATFGSQC